MKPHRQGTEPFQRIQLLLRLASRNLLRHTKKSLLVGILIAVGTAGVLLANSLFESSGKGMETSFVRSLTGDFVVSADAEDNFGLFGDEVPIVEEYQSIPALPDYEAARSALERTEGVATLAPVVSALSMVKIGNYSFRATVFGVDGDSYFAVCSNIVHPSGISSDLASAGVFLNEAQVAAAEKALKRRLRLGEDITFSSYASGSFRIRRGGYAGTIAYPAPNQALDSVALADPTIVRGLCDYTLGYAQESPSAATPATTMDGLDDLFSDAQDSVASAGSGLSLSDVEGALADTEARDELVRTDDAAWSFILVRAVEGYSSDLVRLAASRSLEGTGGRSISWAQAAGSSALSLFAVRSFFQVGVGFLIFGAVLVMMNSLAMTVLERTAEIGTMRALGASRGFVRSLFVAETLMLSFSAAAVGTAVGSILCAILDATGIPLANPLLASLFGGSVLRPGLSLPLALLHLLGAVLVGALAWIYPVHLALKVRPRSAMAEE